MCLPLAAIAQILIWAVVICAALKILSILVSFIAAKMGPPMSEVASLLVQILDIIFWAALVIAVILLVFNLLACLIGGGIHLPGLGR